MDWPIWWNWDIEFTPHLEKRMNQREFSEIDLRRMLERALNYSPDEIEGRWKIQTRYDRSDWEIIVEPDDEEKLLVVITAYRV